MAIHHKWFAERPSLQDGLRFAQYFHCRSNGTVQGFRRKAKFTYAVGLARDDEALLAACTDNNRYKIKRAMREGLAFAQGSFDEFVLMHNAASAAKGRGTTASALLEPYRKAMHITKATGDEGTLVMHAHLFDPDCATAVLMHSASLFRLEAQSQARNRIARANRWLHYRDFLHFRGLGATVYDMGGIAYGTQLVELQHINEFKAGFGGDLVELSNYVSAVSVAWNRLRGGTTEF
jgi:lipid II:glycine glycyltransferase (peptidoglycan interpeptide bridge formation enzyme)